MSKLLSLLAAACVAVVPACVSAQVACDGKVSGAGFATTYTYLPGNGACTFTDDDEPLLAAVNAPQWAGSDFCGRWVRVTGPGGTADVRVVDLCPECLEGDLDLNTAAFQAVTGQTSGRIAITWETIEAPGVGNAGIHVVDTSNPWYVQAQPVDHRYGVAQLELILDQVAYVLPRETNNRFTISSGLGVPLPLASPLTFRATDVHGQQITLDGIELLAGATTITSAQFPKCEDVTDVASVPTAGVRLLAPAPNPFNPSTTIAFELERPAHAVVDVFDVGGRHVTRLLDASTAAGLHSLPWNGTDATGAAVASGVYAVRLRAAGSVTTTRVVLLK